MKKSKIVLSCLAGLLGLTTLFFAGCANSTTNSGGGVTPGGVNSSETENPPTPEQPDPDPVLNGVNNYFSGARAVYSTDTIINENNENKYFTELLDRQFDVLAEDILYRLYVTYGENTYGQDSTFGDLQLYNGNYSYNGNSAIVKKGNLLTILSGHDEDIDSHTTNLDCIYCYQNFINGNSNKLNSTVAIILQEAITGEYCMYDSTMRVLVKHDNLDTPYDSTPYRWQFNNYSLWNTTYRDEFKLALAKIVYGDENSILSYSELLSKINHLGFDESAESKIVNYVNNSVIGSNLIEENLRIYNMFSESEKGNLKNWTNEDEIEKHYFKGYNIVVPAIVKQALGNTFENSDVSLYPTVSNKVSSVLTFNELKSEKGYKEIVLMPNSYSVLVTKMPVKFYSTSSANKTVKVKATVRNAAGKLISEKFMGEVTLSASGSSLSLNFGCTSTIGVYTGDQTSIDTVSMFNNAYNNINLGNNYVMLTFECDEDVTFGIDFEGMYDKN